MTQYLFPLEQRAMTLQDPKGIIGHIFSLARQEQDREHCMLALAKRIGEATYEIFDSCTAEEIGGSTGRNFSSIPQKVSLALIRLCVKQGFVPMILHTHPAAAYLGELVTFSDKDRIYIEKFSAVAMERGVHDLCLFLVTDGQSILLCAVSDRAQQYTRKENLSYACVEKGFPNDHS